MKSHSVTSRLVELLVMGFTSCCHDTQGQTVAMEALNEKGF